MTGRLMLASGINEDTAICWTRSIVPHVTQPAPSPTGRIQDLVPLDLVSASLLPTLAGDSS